jgi:hypothetical protein
MKKLIMICVMAALVLAVTSRTQAGLIEVHTEHEVFPMIVFGMPMAAYTIGSIPVTGVGTIRLARRATSPI